VTAPQQHARPFSVPQVAERWGCSEGLVRKLIRSGELACFRPGTLIRIAAAEVERFECQQQTINTQSSASEVATCGALPTASARWREVQTVALTPVCK